MRYVDEFRNKRLTKKLLGAIRRIMPVQNINIMEVCGTHTQGIHRFGLDKILPGNLRLISGPGCPVCVSAQGYIDSAIELAGYKDVIILTFGDMLHIPGSRSTLEKERARFGNVGVVYSALDSLNVARSNPTKRVVFLAVGFETTAPTIALSIISARKENLKNLFFFSSLKLIPPAMSYLVGDERLNLNGFLCPGHVSVIIGLKPYEFIVRQHGLSCCVTGFEPLDILEGIYLLVLHIVKKNPAITNQYVRAVSRNGNLRAQKIMNRIFKKSDAYWRGLARIPESGLKIRDEFAEFDAERVFHLKRKVQYAGANTKCRCGEVLKGLISPVECPLFFKICRIDNPVGPCMVSNEGACNAYYKYRK